MHIEKKLAVLILILVFATSTMAQSPKPGAIVAMAERLLKKQANNFVFEEVKSKDGKDIFELESKNNKVIIRGNNTNSMAVGLNHYLKYYALTTVSWYKSESINIPAVLPEVPELVRKEARSQNRFFLNYCTYGYTMPWWQWDDWERLIDWMALNGVTMPLAITGQEAIWYKVWKKMGFSDIQIRSYFTGPAYLPWHRMANIDRWDGPLPKGWLDDQLELQKKIVKRERELGMKPVLPAFSGHVPAMLKQKYPEVKLTDLKAFSGFESKCNTFFLDPLDPMFMKIQKAFLEEQTRLFGTDHIYGADPFNELTPPSWEPDYLASVSKTIYKSMIQVDTAAQWLQMGWIFYNEQKNWTFDRGKAFLTAVPQNKMIMLDYFCDKIEVYKLTDKFHGQPYIWNFLSNFGGNTFMKGNIKDIDNKINNVFANGGSNLWGIGSTLEGFDVNMFMFEFVFEKVWSKEPVDLKEWAAQLATRRLGKKDNSAIEAWQLLFDKIYITGDIQHQISLICARPSLAGHSSNFTDNTIVYDNKDLLKAWALMLKSEVTNPTDYYKFDVINLGRQVLGNYFTVARDAFTEAYKRKDIKEVEIQGRKMMGIINDMDELLATNNNFLLGKWLSDAEVFGRTKAEKAYYSEDARKIITIWGGNLSDYASREWSGLMKDYYGERWQLFITDATEALKNRVLFDEKVFNKKIADFGKNWVKRTKIYSSVPSGDYLKTSKALHEKYAAKIENTK